MRHYVAVFAPSEPDGWRALFPDLPGCVAEGPNLEITIHRAADALVQHAGVPIATNYLSPMLRLAAASKLDETWATAHGLSLRTAIVSIIPLRGHDRHQRGWNEAFYVGSRHPFDRAPGAEARRPATERSGDRPALQVSRQGDGNGDAEEAEARE